MPIAATTHSVAAVVRPRIEMPWRMIAPAPRKPIPDTICAAIRVGSKVTPSRLEKWKSRHAYADTRVKTADPTATSRCVRSPAARSRSSRSRPIAPPSAPATLIRASTSSHERSGKERVFLRPRDLVDPGSGQVEQLVEPLPRKRLPLRRRLHLDQLAAAGRDDVDVDVGGRVLRVVEIEQRLAVHDSCGDGGDGTGERLREPEPVEPQLGRDINAGDRGRPCAAVGLQDVAVEPERALAERVEVGDGANGAADQSLDLDRPALLAPRTRLALRPLAGRRRQERVLRGQPPSSLAVQPPWDAVLDARRAEDARLPARDQHRPVRLLEETRNDFERTQLVRQAAVGSHAGAASRSASSTRSTSPSGSCRNRSPSARKSAGSPVVRNRYSPSRSGAFSIPFRASVSATSRAVSSAEKTSVTPRPNTRWKIGRISG